MKKTIYLLLGVLLLTPALALSPARGHQAPRAADNFVYAFAYTAQQESGDYWSISLYFVEWDQQTNTIVGTLNCPYETTLTPSSGPLAGESIDYPANQSYFYLPSVYYPGGPSGIIPGTNNMGYLYGVAVYQGFIPMPQ